MTALSVKESERLRIHSVANLFPMIAEEEYAQLKEDVRCHGVREPVWVWQESNRDFLWLVDGRNRRRCCLDLGLSLPVRHWDGDGSLVEFVMSLNFHRRMLKASQRAIIAAKALPLLEAEAKKRQEASRAKPGQQVGQAPVNLPAPAKGDARDKAAKLANVSGKSVSDAKRVLNKAHRKVVLAVQDGTASVSDAKRIADLPEAEQLEALKAVRAKAAKTLAAAVVEDDREVVKKGVALLERAKRMFDRLEGLDARKVVEAIRDAVRLAERL